MAYTSEHYRVTFAGQLGTGTGFDEWSVNMNFAPTSGLGSLGLPTEDLADALLAAFRTFYVLPTTGISGAAFLKTCKVALVGTDGRYLFDPASSEVGTSSPGGASTGGSASPQDSRVVSWWSGSSLGTANYGRIYLPWAAINVLPDGRTGNSSTIANSAKTFIIAAHAAFDAAYPTRTLRLSIMSNSGSGVTKQVQTIRVGDVVDTQRRRRNKLREIYSMVNL